MLCSVTDFCVIFQFLVFNHRNFCFLLQFVILELVKMFRVFFVAAYYVFHIVISMGSYGCLRCDRCRVG